MSHGGSTLKTKYRARSVSRCATEYSFNHTITKISGYEALFHAICKQASYDIVKHNQYQQTAVLFYRSEWFAMLTGLNGNSIVNRLKKLG